MSCLTFCGACVLILVPSGLCVAGQFRSTTVLVADVPITNNFTMPLGSRSANPLTDLRLNRVVTASGTFDSITYPDNFTPVKDGRRCAGVKAKTVTTWYIFTPFNSDKTADGGKYIDFSGPNGKPDGLPDFHPGEDWNAGDGADDACRSVYPIGKGRVIAKGELGGFGETLFILHRLGPNEFIVSVYAHLNEEPNVMLGESVDTCQPIGRVGRTGTKAFHLHWEIRKESFLINNGSTIQLRTDRLYRPARWPATGSTDNGRAFIDANYWEPSDFVRTRSTAVSSGCSMNLPRTGHQATLMSNGKILVTGGATTATFYTNTAEIFDPQTGTWRFTRLNGTGQQTFMNSPRNEHTATPLPDGERVLIAAGGTTTNSLASSEIFDPLTETFTPTGSLALARHGHKAVALLDGRVMVIAGSSTVLGRAAASCEIYNPASGTWSAAADLPRYGHTDGYRFHAVTLLNNGDVMSSGGYDTAGVFRYNPALNTWRVMQPMLSMRAHHTLTTLPDGRVLIVAGRLSASIDSFTSTEIYSPETLPDGATTPANPLSGIGRANHTATRLPDGKDGKVVVTGGSQYQDTAACRPQIANASVQLFDPATGLWTEIGPMSSPRAYHTATLLPSSGRVLVAGGITQDLCYFNVTILKTADLLTIP